MTNSMNTRMNETDTERQQTKGKSRVFHGWITRVINIPAAERERLASLSDIATSSLDPEDDAVTELKQSYLLNDE